MTIIRVLFLASVMLSSTLVFTNVYAECTLQAAQTKMIETTNMMQVYNRQRITYIENTQTVPASFESQFNAFDERKNQLVTQLGEETDANPNIGLNDQVNQSLCDGYDELFAKYAPSDYVNKEVDLKSTSSDPSCTTNGLWGKYGELIQEQAALSKAGKLGDAESAEMMRLSTEIGVAATTDLSRACSLMSEFEDMIKSS